MAVVKLLKEVEDHCFKELGLEEEKHRMALPKSREESLWSCCVKINISSLILLFSCINHLLTAQKCKDNMWLWVHKGGFGLDERVRGERASLCCGYQYCLNLL